MSAPRLPTPTNMWCIAGALLACIVVCASQACIDDSGPWMNGTVDWYFRAKGMGYIVNDENPLKKAFYYFGNAALLGENPGNLYTGMKVEYKAVPGVKSDMVSCVRGPGNTPITGHFPESYYENEKNYV